MVLCTYPIEHMAAQTMAVNPEPTWRLYSALADVAQVLPEARVNDPRVIVGEMVHEDGRRFVWLINASDTPLVCTPFIATGTLRDLTHQERQSSVELGPFGVSVLERVP
jgi:hypothetical protein